MFGEDRHTQVEIDGEAFAINGRPTLEGREYEGHSLEGLLFNARMVQAIFDDGNAGTRDVFAYPDTGEWDPERNVREFCRAMPEWQGTERTPRLQAISINFQGGRPVRAAPDQPWVVSGFRPDGSLDDAWLARLERVLDRADLLGMVVILGYFYFGQEGVLEDDEAIRAGARNLTEWLLEREYTNVLIEVDNECNVAYDSELLRPGGVDELIRLVRGIERDGFRYDVGTSFGGGAIPTDDVLDVSDFALLHGNGVHDPDRIAGMVDETRARSGYGPMPIVFNEDPHYGFDSEPNNLLAAVRRGASWGYFDPGTNNYRDGYQCPPVNWGITTERERSFFEYLTRIVSENPTVR